ncbi:MAG: phosphate ABC transporter permease subunit PstC [Hyphomicrobium sp.]
MLVLLTLLMLGYVLGYRRARIIASDHIRDMHSLPAYHGLYAATLSFIPALLTFIIGNQFTHLLAKHQSLALLPETILKNSLQHNAALNQIINLALGHNVGEVPTSAIQTAAATYSSILTSGNFITLSLGALIGFLSLTWALNRISFTFQARNSFERFVNYLLLFCAMISVLTTAGIVFSVIGETYRFFFDPNITGKPSVFDFLFGTDWNPQAAMRADQGEIQTSFGFLPLLAGTLLITCIALLVAGPLGLLSAIYLAEYASPQMRALAKPILEILAGIPTVVLGFFAALTVAPLVRDWGVSSGFTVSSESALAAGLVMGMMIIPFISSLSDDVINAVPQSLRDGSYSMGATKSETIKKVILPAALPGIVSAFMLAISRAIGETMIVVMAAGLAAKMTLNPLDAVTTITVQIKTILVGDQEFDSAKTLAAFALGFVLFFITLALNYIALKVVMRYREQYE